MDSHVYWIGVAVLIGVGLIVPIQAEEGSLDGFLTQMYARFWNDLADHASA